jgi:hypothetical protein
MATNRTLATERKAALTAADRDKLRTLRARVRDARYALAESKKRHTKERASELLRFRRLVKDAKRADVVTRSDMVDKLLALRGTFNEWWFGVQKERARRLAEIKEWRGEILKYSAGRKARFAEVHVVAELSKADALDELDDKQSREYEALASRLLRAKQDLQTEQRDQREMRRTHKTASVARVTRKEKREEYTGGVEANLETSVELAVWKHARKQILTEAKRRHVSAPDAVAEIVREWAEFDPDRAMGYLITDAEQWVTTETRKRAA